MHWAHWDEETEYILFSGLSGDTHILDEFGHRLIHLLQMHSLSPNELAKQILLSENSFTDLEQLNLSIDTYLTEYRKRGLIEVCEE